MNKLLGTWQALFIGLASMLGAGVFVVFGPAAKYAGAYLPIAVLLAAAVAYLNAKSIAQLASVVTRSGGAYAYARHYLNPTFGFLAGTAFLVGKLGSVAAIALTFAHYLTPGFEVITALAAIALMTAVNILGINRTAFGAMVLASITVTFLAVVIVAALTVDAAATVPAEQNPQGIFTASAMMFFAFAGYARVATLGGEVKNPETAIPRAINISLLIVFSLYLALALVLQLRLGGDVGLSLTPIADLVGVTFGDGAADWIWIFAAVAALGSLLALLAGMSRTAATMAEDHELPSIFSFKNSKGTPWVAEVAIASVGALLVVSNSFEFVIGISSFAVLTYYAIANWAAYRQPKTETSRPKFSNLLGLVLCLALAFSVPVEALALGVVSLLALSLLRFGLAKLR